MVEKKRDTIAPRASFIPERISNVLYIEDEDINWTATERHLKKIYKLRRARNARESFALLTREQFDLILIDIQLAGSEFDGIEICRILKRLPGQFIPPAASRLKYEEIPVIFVTAYSSNYSKMDLLESAGADEVVTKPVDFTRLRLVSSRLIARTVMASL